MPSAPSVDPVQPSEHSAGHCIGCGYPLLGLIEPRCPECGLAFDPDHPAPADIPWLARREIGNLKAYISTIHRVLLCPREFAAQVHRTGDVNRMEAKAFWHVTLVVATISMLGTVVPPILTPHAPHGVSQLVSALVGMALLSVPAGVFFWIATCRIQISPVGMGLADEYRFPRIQKFACAGLGLAPIVPAVTWAWIAMVELGFEPLGPLPEVFIGMACAVVLAAWLGGDFTFHLLGGRLRASQAAWFIVARLAVLAAAGLLGSVAMVLVGPVAAKMLRM